MPKIFAIHHITILTSSEDYLFVKTFYTEILGFHIIREVFDSEQDFHQLALAIEEKYQIELISAHHPPERPSYPEAKGLRHMAFATGNLDEAISYLCSRHVEVEKTRIDPITGRSFTFFADPQNQPLEIYEADDVPRGLSSIHHVAILTSNENYASTKAFYTEILGFDIIKETYRAERESYKLDLAVGGKYQIELFSFLRPPERLSSPEAKGLKHLAFTVDSLDTAIADLRLKGVEVEEKRQDWVTGGYFVFFRGPDRQLLELHEADPKDVTSSMKSIMEKVS